MAQLKEKIAAGMMKHMHVSASREPDESLLDTLPLMATSSDIRFKDLLLGLMGASKIKTPQENMASAADNLEATSNAFVVIKQEAR